MNTNTVTISLKKYHQLLDYERFTKEQDVVLIRDLSETEAILISKDDTFKVLEDTNNELCEEIDNLQGQVEKLQSQVDDNTLRKQLESRDKVDAQLAADLAYHSNQSYHLQLELNKLNNLSFWQKVKKLFK